MTDSVYSSSSSFASTGPGLLGMWSEPVGPIFDIFAISAAKETAAAQPSSTAENNVHAAAASLNSNCSQDYYYQGGGNGGVEWMMGGVFFAQYYTTMQLSWWFVSLCLLLSFYWISEVAFYFYFQYHLVPIASQRRSSDPYHDYPEPADRVRLLRRILLRLQQKAARRTATAVAVAAAHSQQHNDCNDDDTQQQQQQEQEQYDHQQVIREFCLPWFDYVVVGTTEPAVVIATAPNMVSKKEDVPVLPSETRNFAPPLSIMVSSSSSVTSSTGDSSASLSSNTNEDANSVQSCCEDDVDNGAGAVAQPEANAMAALSPSSSSSPHQWTIPGLKRPAVEDFFAWGFFAKDTPELTKAEQLALEECFHSLRELTGLVMDESSSQESLYRPRRLSIEKVQAMHRPWLVYAVMAISQLFQRYILLPWLGYQRVTASNVKLTAWFRPAAADEDEDKQKKNDVCLFFHGLAPSGLICYVPMMEAILGKRQQSLVMFENPSIMCLFHALPNFHVLTEGETILGILDILSQLRLDTKDHSLTVMGHSFGSCPVTWLLRRRHEFTARIQHVVLLDPVTVLLSQPSVMTRFLYERDDRAKLLIRFVVASELFTEFYLRRHFCWYNAELWLEDYFSNNNNNNHHDNKAQTMMETNNNPAKWTFVLSGCDEIVPASCVQEHITSLKNEYNFEAAKIVYWPHAKHANCVISPLRWKMMRSFLFCGDNNNNNKNDNEKPKQE